MNLSGLKDTAANWLERGGKILALARLSRAAGSRSFALFDDTRTFIAWVDGLPPDTDLLVIRDFELPIRGAASPEMIESLPPPGIYGAWLVIIDLTEGSFDWAETVEEVQDLVNDHMGQIIAIGPLPDWNRADDENLASAVIPRPDGSVVRGIY